MKCKKQRTHPEWLAVLANVLSSRRLLVPIQTTMIKIFRSEDNAVINDNFIKQSNRKISSVRLSTTWNPCWTWA